MDLYVQLKEIDKKQEAILSLLTELHGSGAVNNKEKVYDLTDLEQLLKISRRTLFKHLSSGILEHTKIGKKIYIREEQLQKFLSKKNY